MLLLDYELNPLLHALPSLFCIPFFSISINDKHLLFIHISYFISEVQQYIFYRQRVTGIYTVSHACATAHISIVQNVNILM